MKRRNIMNHESITTTTSKEGTPLVSPTKDHEKHDLKKKLSLLPFIFAIEIIFALGVIWTCFSAGVISARDAAFLTLCPLLQFIWGAAAIYLGSEYQYFARDKMLRSFPMVILPIAPAVIQIAVFMARWDAVSAMLDWLPRSTFVGLHTLRVLAVGSLIKWYWGIFPAAFAGLTALPDFLFGTSAVWLLTQHSDWMQTDAFLFWWNVVGFLIILPFGVFVVQLGMEPTQFYRSKVSYKTLFEYPMVLGPIIVVPTLLSWNATVALWCAHANY
jgi:hypothetical protein